MSNFNIDTKSVRKLAELLKESGLSEIEYAEGDKRIKVAMGGFSPQTSFVQMAAPAPVGSVEVKEETPAVPAGTSVIAPMVGTIYMAPAPGEKPFVKVGDKVKQGDTLLIIEAMKVMNPIKAPHAGEIVEIMVSDAKPVEFGETLLIISQ
ncbi:MAG: acetyl-CoA carboxylase biotin carboxyl carrier protein [Alphaproteobacteria bacterium]|nr:acetyl-CoA carboxylase biotin carboxyl carrier protein [Alphaproteobacteria bacterium]